MYDNWVEVIFDYLGCRILNARKVINHIGFNTSFYSKEKDVDGNVDWYHGSDTYYEVISKELVGIIKGGFKFEAQRALKIDGTPLKVF